MIREMLAAFAFLTRIPLSMEPFNAAEVGGASRWFPLVGIFLGAIYAGVAFVTASFPPLITGLLVLAAEAILTGALHLDGLADMADGFGAGRSREDVLRIMRDHAIGAYGAIALILLIGLKAASIAALVETAAWIPYLILAPALGRWAAVLMSVLQPYARDSGPSQHVGRKQLLFAGALTALPLVYFGLRSLPLVVATVAITLAMAAYCKRRIGGITGDTIGATVEAVELSVLLIGVKSVS